ncbi:hypothetical protein [Tengunoibacter tsumagoiensis]|uniref:Response regulatory domain-containing protein n=1 Tax=Tengunoibacter tsumagoiensis TaxID=2014871 RepID=A0A402A6K4_9CHLR|nr:hypothetical protein [Tengunoibacter tsumagoiensis]GCE14719.1 hypothetical protein KTT_45780 [Tengunoibacter tsumagoiensis]
MEQTRVVLLGYERDRIDLYGSILKDEGYDVYLLYPNEANIQIMNTLMPHIVLVDVTKVHCQIGPALFQWLQEHTEIAVLFCMDRYLEAPQVIAYAGNNNETIYADPFSIDGFVEKIRHIQLKKTVLH